jgi:hypothetical protein
MAVIRELMKATLAVLVLEAFERALASISYKYQMAFCLTYALFTCLVHVNPNCLPPLTELLRGEKDVEPCTTSQVNHCLAFIQVR